MRCPNCHNEINENSDFCRYCGTDLRDPDRKFNKNNTYSEFENSPNQNVRYNMPIHNNEPYYSDKNYNHNVVQNSAVRKSGTVPIIVLSCICCILVGCIAGFLIFSNMNKGGDSIKTEENTTTAATTISASTSQETQTEQTTETQMQTTAASETTAATKKSTSKKPKATTTVNKYAQTVTPPSTSNLGEMYVSTNMGSKNNLSCRIGPGYNYNKAFSSGIPSQTLVTILSEQYDSLSAETWAYVEYNGKYGWVTEKYLSNYAEDYPGIDLPDNYVDSEYRPHFTVVVDDLLFREGPSQNKDTMCKIPKGTQLEEYGYSNDKWIYTKYKGQYGWLMAYSGSTIYCQFDGGMGKPVIYLYPEKKTDVSVKLKLLTADLATTYPKYDNGWNVTAFPDGTIKNKADGGTFDYLFWESKNDRTEYDMSSGFVVKGEDTEKFLKEKLSYMGLNEKEYNEFIVYWLPLMENNKYNLISFQSDAYTDNVRLDITPKPDSMLRVYMTYKPLEKKVNIPEQKLKTFKRKGFTVVEWGGTKLSN